MRRHHLRGPDTSDEEKRCCLSCWKRRGVLVRDDEPHGAWACTEASQERRRYEGEYGVTPDLLYALVRAQRSEKERWALIGTLMAILRRRGRCMKVDFPPRPHAVVVAKTEGTGGAAIQRAGRARAGEGAQGRGRGGGSAGSQRAAVPLFSDRRDGFPPSRSKKLQEPLEQTHSVQAASGR